jgi:hypothetical protein
MAVRRNGSPCLPGPCLPGPCPPGACLPGHKLLNAHACFQGTDRCGKPGYSANVQRPNSQTRCGLKRSGCLLVPFHEGGTEIVLTPCVSFSATTVLTFVSISVTCKRSRSFEGRIPDAIRSVERVRCFRADSQSAPERLRASGPSVLRPRREVLSLDWDRRGRVTPAGFRRACSSDRASVQVPGNMAWSRVGNVTVPGQSRGVAPEGGRAPIWRAAAPGISRRQRLLMLRGHGWLAPFGASPPSYCRRQVYFGASS